MKTARFLKFFIASFFVVLLLLTFQKQVFAQNYNYQPSSNHAIPETNPDVPRNLHTYSQSVIIELISSLSCVVSGTDSISPDKACLGIDAKTGKIGYVEKNGGLIGVSSNLIAMTFTPSIHVNDFSTYLASNFGITKSAYAQGTGFTGLNPLLDAWIAFRNIVYILFVIVFVFIGIAIMLRVKIDPRTVMSVQNQIPKIIISLVLITFSYAIAGLLIDLMWIFIYMLFNLFHRADPTGIDIPRITANLGDTPFGFADKIMGESWGLVALAGNVAGAVGSIVQSVIDGALGPVGWLASRVLGGIGAGLAFLIVSIAILFALFRIWFTLLKSYILILSATLFGPFWILIGNWPNSKIKFGTWIRYLLSSLMSFVITIAMFLLGKVLIDAFSVPQPGGFIPPLVGGAGDLKVMGSLLGFGIILLTPNANNYAKKIFQPPEIDIAPITKALGVGAGSVNAPAKFGWKRLTRPYSLYEDPGPVRRIIAGKNPQSKRYRIASALIGGYNKAGGALSGVAATSDGK